MQSSPRSQAIAQFGYAALFMALMLGMWVFLPIPWIWDINHPDFMPLIALYPFLGAMAAYRLVLGARWWLRAQRFGDAKLELSGPAPRLGGRLQGTVIAARPVQATGDYRVALQYVETHNLDRYDVRSARNFVIWEHAVSAPPGTDATQGIPFSIPLPDQVRAPEAPRRPDEIRREYSVAVPMLGKIWTNKAPRGAHWQLVVTAPTAGADFSATFPVDVRMP